MFKNLPDSFYFNIILLCMAVCVGCVVLTGLIVVMNGGVVCV